jgi:hypothetical protein
MNDSELANDRTFLAWFRTAIALFGLGFVIAKVALIVDSGSGGVSDEALYTGVGGAPEPGAEQLAPRWSRSMTRAAVVGSLVLSTLLIVTTS